MTGGRCNTEDTSSMDEIEIDFEITFGPVKEREGEREKEGGRERERGRKGGREREREREEGKETERGREGGRERGRKGGKQREGERGREGGRKRDREGRDERSLLDHYKHTIIMNLLSSTCSNNSHYRLWDFTHT